MSLSAQHLTLTTAWPLLVLVTYITLLSACTSSQPTVARPAVPQHTNLPLLAPVAIHPAPTPTVISTALPDRTSSTPLPPTPRPQRTRTAVIERPHLTRTADTLSRPTPTVPANLPNCTATDLAGTYDSDAGAGWAFFVLTYTNISPTTCVLQGPPAIRLVDHQGQPLDIRYHYACQYCLIEKITDYAPMVRTPLIPTATAAAHNILFGRIALPPQAQATVRLLKPPSVCDGTASTLPPVGGATIQLTFTNDPGTVDVASHLALQQCDEQNGPPSIMIQEFVRK